MGVNLKFHVTSTFLCLHAFGTWVAVKVHSYMRTLTCVPVVVCVAHSLRLCPSYSRRGDCLNLGLLRSLSKGRGAQANNIKSTQGRQLDQ